MAAIPRRAPALESALTDVELSSVDMDELAAAIAQDFQPIDDARATANYRLTVAARLLTRLQQEYIGKAATRAHPLGANQAGASAHG
jgi:xanthine dehydrogenase small subunit